MTDTRQSNIEESIATERERDRYKAALEHIADDPIHALHIARKALDKCLRAGELTATHAGPLTAEQLADKLRDH